MREAFQTFSFVVGIIGLAVNLFVIFVLLYYRQLAKNATNKFIFNQTVMDAMCCAGLVIYVAVGWGSKAGLIGIFYKGAIGWIRCLIINTQVKPAR